MDFSNLFEIFLSAYHNGIQQTMANTIHFVRLSLLLVAVVRRRFWSWTLQKKCASRSDATDTTTNRSFELWHCERWTTQLRGRCKYKYVSVTLLTQDCRIGIFYQLTKVILVKTTFSDFKFQKFSLFFSDFCLVLVTSTVHVAKPDSFIGIFQQSHFWKISILVTRTWALINLQQSACCVTFSVKTLARCTFAEIASGQSAWKSGEHCTNKRQDVIFLVMGRKTSNCCNFE
jgi:hypothetical protein